jgi:hypothetical protein
MTEGVNVVFRIEEANRSLGFIHKINLNDLFGYFIYAIVWKRSNYSTVYIPMRLSLSVGAFNILFFPTI